MVRKIKNIPSYAMSLCRTEMVRRLPSFYALFPVRPRSANINITDRCCFKCVMCNQWSGSVKKELSTGQWKDVIRQLKKIGVKRINISGGEPLLRADIADLICFASSLNLRTTLLTNGFLLDKGMFRRLIDSGLESISVSVDGVGAEFEKVRGIPGAYQKVERACRLLSEEARKGSITATISFLVMKETVGHLKGVLELRKSLGLPLAINLADFTPYFFAGRKREDFWIKDRAALGEVQKMLISEKAKDTGSIIPLYSEINFIKDYFADPLQKSMPCAVSQERICIDPEGTVFGGCWSMDSLGNVKEKPLGDIVRSQEYRRAHKKMFFKMCPGCSCGFSANLRSFLPYVAQEIVYRTFPSSRKSISK